MTHAMISPMSPTPFAPERVVPPEWVEAALAASGVSQSEVARRLEVTQGTVNRWARGKAPVSWSRWLAILAALDLPQRWTPPEAEG